MSNKAPPSEADLEKFFEKDVICWKKAVQMVEEKRAKKQKRKPNKLKKKPNPSGSSEPDSSKSITDPDNAQQSTAVTAQELIQIAQTAHANSSKQRGTAKDIFYKIVFYFERHSQVIDVFIQQEPKFTAIVWGSIRYLLWVIVDYEQASEVTAEGILLVVQQAERWSRMARCYGHQQSVENATVYLYVQVLEFLQSATERFGQGKWDKQANKEILKILRTPETPQGR
ncbi:uncharacterized protein BKA55DRAFT_294039 [Fusarium redolens]|uniref:DUF7708 domain-containing protein n=1 Tax=Fusarium redolens TaxID=48865 RepID=A0A9P9HJT6_FUSRE|nr:uncharacterized protein BKA55DRAFT_294039 [Fusarium redolens]KAH7258919.1 hypothetical protein BKA55DRAFT_294039 [Fusarium redolens]